MVATHLSQTKSSGFPLARFSTTDLKWKFFQIFLFPNLIPNFPFVSLLNDWVRYFYPIVYSERNFCNFKFIRSSLTRKSSGKICYHKHKTLFTIGLKNYLGLLLPILLFNKIHPIENFKLSKQIDRKNFHSKSQQI